jgi:hypothetical protein
LVHLEHQAATAATGLQVLFPVLPQRMAAAEAVAAKALPVVLAERAVEAAPVAQRPAMAVPGPMVLAVEAPAVAEAAARRVLLQAVMAGRVVLLSAMQAHSEPRAAL